MIKLIDVYTRIKLMGRVKGQVTKAKGVPTSDWGNDLKVLRTFRLTPRAFDYMEKCKQTYGLSSRTDLIEALGVDYVVVPKKLLEDWLEESKDTTSPRWEKAKKLLADIKDELPDMTLKT